jgi:hypothetical protein
LIAKEYARTLTGYGLMYGLTAAAAEAQGKKASDYLTFDPRSTDFGKIRIGNTRVDPLAGISQATVAPYRLISGKMVTQKGEVRPLRGPEVKFGQMTGREVINRFFESKLSPWASLAYHAGAGETFRGDPTNAQNLIGDMVFPLSFGDIGSAFKEQGLPAGAALSLLAMLGASIQTYSPKVLTEKQRLRKELKERIKVE